MKENKTIILLLSACILIFWFIFFIASLGQKQQETNNVVPQQTTQKQRQQEYINAAFEAGSRAIKACQMNNYQLFNQYTIEMYNNFSTAAKFDYMNIDTWLIEKAPDECAFLYKQVARCHDLMR